MRMLPVPACLVNGLGELLSGRDVEPMFWLHQGLGRKEGSPPFDEVPRLPRLWLEQVE